MRIMAAAALLASMTGCAAHIGGAGVDHVLLGTSSLAAGTAEFERLTGVRPVIGGQHPDRGTENALVALDGPLRYIEIIAPRAGVPLTGELAEMAALKKLTPIGWAVHVDDVEEAQRELTHAGFTLTPPRPGSRVTPEGKTLKWTTFGIVEPKIDTAPFFIRWGDGVSHPSTTSPHGCELHDMWLGDPNDAALHRLLTKLGLSIHSRRSAKPEMKLQLICRTGEIVFATE